MAPEQARDTRQASVASDMFSLGAALLFAATGHPPYLGDTVMDILVRLATEAPDLTGLPAELIPVVTACLQRSPRDRPTSTALLAELAPFVGATASPGSGHSYLPASTLTLIGEYERGPGTPEPRPGHDHGQPPLTDEMSEDDTFGSYVALPAAPGAPPTRRPPKRVIVGVALSLGAAALLAVGAVLGASLTDASGRAPAHSGASSPTPSGTATYPTLPPCRQGTLGRLPPRCPTGRPRGRSS